MAQLRNKEQTIKRFSEGYDTKVFKRFVAPFVVAADSIDGLIDSKLSKAEALANLKRLLVEQALGDCGVEPFSCSPGTPFVGAIGLDEPTLVPTEDPAKHGMIESTFRPGYWLRLDDPNSTPHVFLKAKVRVYSHTREATSP